jgi:hypothetical protein
MQSGLMLLNVLLSMTKRLSAGMFYVSGRSTLPPYKRAVETK